jgi:hypothetical protein
MKESSQNMSRGKFCGKLKMSLKYHDDSSYFLIIAQFSSKTLLQSSQNVPLDIIEESSPEKTKLQFLIVFQQKKRSFSCRILLCLKRK